MGLGHTFDYFMLTWSTTENWKELQFLFFMYSIILLLIPKRCTSSSTRNFLFHLYAEFLSDFLHRQNLEGDTALHILARSNQHTTAAQILVEASADLHTKNREVLYSFISFMLIPKNWLCVIQSGKQVTVQRINTTLKILLQGFSPAELAADRGSNRMVMYLNYEVHKRTKKPAADGVSAANVKRVIVTQVNCSKFEEI